MASGVVGPKVARGSVPRQNTEGIEYRSRRSLADRLVVAERSLLAGVGVERRGRLTWNDESINQGSGSGRKRGSMPKPEGKSFAIPKQLVWQARGSASRSHVCHERKEKSM